MRVGVARRSSGILAGRRREPADPSEIFSSGRILLDVSQIASCRRWPNHAPFELQLSKRPRNQAVANRFQRLKNSRFGSVNEESTLMARSSGEAGGSKGRPLKNKQRPSVEPLCATAGALERYFPQTLHEYDAEAFYPERYNEQSKTRPHQYASLSEDKPSLHKFVRRKSTHALRFEEGLPGLERKNTPIASLSTQPQLREKCKPYGIDF